MSTSLLRKGLELLGEEDLIIRDAKEERKVVEPTFKYVKKINGLGGRDPQGSKKDKNASFAKKGKTPIAEPLGTRKTMTRQCKQKGRQKRNAATVKGKVVRSAIEEYKKQHGVDNLKRNLKYMLDAKFVADCTVTKQVLDQNRGRKSLDRKSEKPKKKAAASVFTDADFKRFEREYFGGGSDKL